MIDLSAILFLLGSSISEISEVPRFCDDSPLAELQVFLEQKLGGSESTPPSFWVKEIPVSLPLRTKQIPVEIKNPEVVREQMKDSILGLLPAFYMRAEAGREYKAGDKIQLDGRGGIIPPDFSGFFDSNGKPFMAELSKNYLGPADEPLKSEVMMLRGRDEASGSEIQVTLLSVRPPDSNFARAQAMLDEIKEQGASDEELAQWESYLQSQNLATRLTGFVVTHDKSKSTFALYPVSGTAINNEYQIELSEKSSQLHDLMRRLTEALHANIELNKAKRPSLPASTDEIQKLKNQHLIAALRNAIRQSVREIGQKEGGIKTLKVEGRNIHIKLPNGPGLEIPGWLSAVELLRWSNKDRLSQEDEVNQVNALALQPKIKGASLSNLAGMWMSAHSERCSDDFTCSFSFANLQQMVGKKTGPESASLFRFDENVISHSNVGQQKNSDSPSAMLWWHLPSNESPEPVQDAETASVWDGITGVPAVYSEFSSEEFKWSK